MKKKMNFSLAIIVVIASLTISCKNTSSNDSSQIDSTSVTDSKNAAGNWELYNFEDEFGDKTSKKYLGITGKGTVSANANKNFDMTAYLFIRNEEIFFKFHLEDLQYVCPDNLPITMKIKDSDGEVYSFDFICKQNGEIGLKTESENKQPYYQFISILEKGGVISGSTEIYHSPYKFKIDVSGYQDALKRI